MPLRHLDNDPSFGNSAATLVFDSRINRPEGARASAALDARRQFVWHSSRADLALTMWSDRLSRHSISLDGQVLPHDDGPLDYRVQILIEGVLVAESSTDLAGCFGFEGLDRGDYEFRLIAADHEINTRRIEVDEAP